MLMSGLTAYARTPLFQKGNLTEVLEVNVRIGAAPNDYFAFLLFFFSRE